MREKNSIQSFINLSIEQVFNKLGSPNQGLTHKEAQRRLLVVGVMAGDLIFGLILW